MAEKRELQITATMRDQITRVARKVGRVLSTVFVKPLRAIRNLSRRLLSLKTAVVGLFAAVAARAGARAFSAVIESVDQLAKLAPTVNDTVENISRLAFAFEDAGFKGEFLQTMMTALSRQSSQAIRNNRQMVEAFERLGITVDDIRRLGATDLFRQIASSLEQTGTTADKAAALQLIFADNFRKLLTVVGKGREEFEKALALIDQYGGPVTGQQAALSELYTQTLLKLQTAFESVVRVMLVEFGPKVLPMLDEFAKFIARSGPQIAEFAKQAVRAFTALAVSMAQLTIAIVRMMESLPSVFGEVQKILVDGSAEQRAEFARLTASMRKLQKEQTALLDQRFLRQAGPVEQYREWQQELQRVSGRLADLKGFISQLTREGGGIPLSEFLERNLEALSAQLAKAEKAMRDAASIGAKTDGSQKPDGKKLTPPTSAWERFWSMMGENLAQTSEQFSGLGSLVLKSTNAAQRAFDGLANTLTDIILGTKSAKEAFRALAQAVIRDLVKIAVEFAIVSVVRRVAGLAKGGIVQGGLGGRQQIPGYADGHVTSGPELAVIGEGKHNEAVVPLPDGRRIPVDLRSSGGGGTTVNFYVDAVDGSSVRRLLTDEREHVWALVQAGVQGGSRDLHMAVAGK